MRHLRSTFTFTEQHLLAKWSDELCKIMAEAMGSRASRRPGGHLEREAETILVKLKSLAAIAQTFEPGPDSDLLDRIEAFLDDHADAEGNGPADYRPNKAMRLLKDLREVREKGRG